MIKQDLKVGYLLKRRNGIFVIIMPTCGTLALVNGDVCFCYLSDYKNDLKHYCCSEYDIVEVYDCPTFGSDCLKTTIGSRSLLWPKKKQISKIEAEKALEAHYGHSVEII